MPGSNHKILTVAPTVGEAVQGIRLLRLLGEQFPDFRRSVLVEEGAAGKVISDWDKAIEVLTYDRDEPGYADELLEKTGLGLILNIEGCYYTHLMDRAVGAGIPVWLISAAMNDAIAVHPRFEPFLENGGLAKLERIGVKHSGYLERFARYGASMSRLFVSGDLKLDAERLGMNDEERTAIRKKLGWTGRRAVVAGSVSLEEGFVFLDVFRTLRERRQVKTSLMIAPRYLEHGSDIVKRCTDLGLSVEFKTQLWQNNHEPDTGPDVVVLDTFGELGRLYNAGDVTFVGGTLKPFSDKPLGQNILEPLFHARPLVLGPNVKKEARIAKMLHAYWPGARVGTPGELLGSLEALIFDDELRKRYREFIRTNLVFDRNLKNLKEQLEAAVKRMGQPDS